MKSKNPILLIHIIFIFCINRVHSKTYSRCELAEALRARGLTDSANWVSLVESESGRRTNAVGPPNRDGSRDYGLFQVNGRIWCNQGGGGCGLPCSSLTDDNIDDDVRCAKIIFSRQGFGAWYGWQHKCQGRDLSAYRCGGSSGTPDGGGSPCAAKGGQCKNRHQCNGQALERIDGRFGCPNDPNDIWCCITGGGSPCAAKGGQCKRRADCAGQPVEKIDGGWSCPHDPSDVWCCLPGGGGSPCAAKGGQCKRRGDCTGNFLEKIDGAWGCPHDPNDVWCCL